GRWGGSGGDRRGVVRSGTRGCKARERGGGSEQRGAENGAGGPGMWQKTRGMLPAKTSPAGSKDGARPADTPRANPAFTMPQPVPPEPALLSAPPERLDDAALLAAVRAGEPEDGGLRFTAFRRLADWFLPERLRRAALDTRRRARFVVLMAFAMVPFYAVLAQQLWESGLRAQSAVAAAFGLAVLGSPFLLRLTRSHVVPGSLVCVLNTLIVFIQAYTDAGLSDPILYWAALVPLAAALSVGPWLSLVSALLSVAGIGFLSALTLDGHPFPHATPQPLLDLAAFLSVSTASVFAFVWGWLYEGQTLRELRLLNGRLGQLRAALSHSEARYRSLFERVPLGVYRTTPDGQVIVVNPALVRLLGYDTV